MQTSCPAPAWQGMGAPVERGPCLGGNSNGVGNKAWLSRKTKQVNKLRYQGFSLQNPERLLGEGNLATEIREEKDPAHQDGREVLENQASERGWCETERR